MRYLILGLLCLMAGIAYIQRAAISVPAELIATDLKIEHFERSMGWVQSAWYLGYALLQIPAGRMADLYGSRRTLALLCSIWSTLALLTGFSTGWYSLMLFWFLMGAAQAGAFPCAAAAISQTFPESQRARASGILAAGMAVGGAVAPMLAGRTLNLLQPAAATWQLYSWQILLFLFSLPGFLWTGLFLITVPNSALPVTAQKEKTSRLSHMLPLILKSTPLALLCTQQFLRAAGMVFFLTWFPVFLQKTRGIEIKLSADLTSLAGIGGVLGSLTGGIASDWLLKTTGNRRLSRQGIAVVGMSLCSILIVSSAFVHNLHLSITLVAAGAFCATFGGVSGYTVAIEFGGSQVATVFSLMNMCGNFGAMLFPITSGWMVERFRNWELMLFFFAAIMAIDAICWAFLNPQRPLFSDSDSDFGKRHDVA